ncbi:MAG: hypothetical protein RL641_434 [Candidatus Parcubacteria bacterium]|jgi:hypothetical protein
MTTRNIQGHSKKLSLEEALNDAIDKIYHQNEQIWHFKLTSISGKCGTDFAGINQSELIVEIEASV